jgi:hypothetical protein
MITELEAATAYARAWNQLDGEIFIELLAEDAIYSSQWDFTPLKGKEAIRAYLVPKIQTVKEVGARVYAELATTSDKSSTHDCVAMAQGEQETVQAVVVFKVKDGFLKQVVMCQPEAVQIVRSGKYPE